MVDNVIGTAIMPDGSNLSFDALPQNKFRLVVNKMPWVVLFLQEFTLPEVVVKRVTRNTPYVDINEIGEKIDFMNFNCTFLVDDNMKNYKEIFQWMKRMTASGGSNPGEDDEVTLIINGKESIKFYGAWPTSLSGMQFIANAQDQQYITCTVELDYDYFDFVKQD